MKANVTKKTSHVIAYLSYYRLERPFLRGFLNPLDLDDNQDMFVFMNRSDRGSIRSDWSMVGHDLSNAMMSVHQ